MSDSVNKIDYVEIPAPDLVKAKEFYSAVFGWTMKDYGDSYSCFDDKRLTGGLTKDRRPVENGVLLVIYVSDIAHIMDKITAAGGTETVPKFAFPGGYRAHFKDPNGNELAIWSES